MQEKTAITSSPAMPSSLVLVPYTLLSLVSRTKQDMYIIGIIIIDASVLKLRRGVFCWGLRNEPGVQNQPEKPDFLHN